MVRGLSANSANTHVVAVHEAVVSWPERTGLPLNKRKCKMLSIGRKGNSHCVDLPDVPYVHELKILGVTFSANGNWNAQIA